MDLGEYVEPYSEYEYGYVNRVEQKEVSDISITYDDGESSQVPKADAGRVKKARKATHGENIPEKVYEIPNVYAEIPNANYETLQPDQGTIELPMSAPPQASTPDTRQALPGEPQQQPCCGKCTRFWCLLTAALSTVIVILVASLLTGNNLFHLEYEVKLKLYLFNTNNSSSKIEYSYICSYFTVPK